MFRVLAAGEERHLLEDADGTPVGWIHGRTIGFRDLTGEARVLAAAAAAWQALETVLYREFGARPQPARVADRLRFTHDGAAEWIAVGSRTIARVHRLAQVPGRITGFALEFELPSYAHEGTAIVAAQVMGRAIREQEGWSHGAEPRPAHAPPAETAARPPTSAPGPDTSASGVSTVGTPTRAVGVAPIIAPA